MLDLGRQASDFRRSDHYLHNRSDRFDPFGRRVRSIAREATIFDGSVAVVRHCRRNLSADTEDG